MNSLFASKIVEIYAGQTKTVELRGGLAPNGAYLMFDAPCAEAGIQLDPWPLEILTAVDEEEGEVVMISGYFLHAIISGTEYLDTQYYSGTIYEDEATIPEIYTLSTNSAWSVDEAWFCLDQV